MDKDRVVGSAKQVKGAVKQAVGKAVGDVKLESEGQADKVEGKISECHRRAQRHGQRRAQRKIGVASGELLLLIPPTGEDGKGHSSAPIIYWSRRRPKAFGLQAEIVLMGTLLSVPLPRSEACRAKGKHMRTLSPAAALDALRPLRWRTSAQTD